MFVQARSRKERLVAKRNLKKAKHRLVEAENQLELAKVELTNKQKKLQIFRIHLILILISQITIVTLISYSTPKQTHLLKKEFQLTQNSNPLI